MPRKNNSSNTENKSKKELTFEKLDSFEILRAVELEYKGNKHILADVKLNGVCIYGVRPVTFTDKADGKEKDFLSWPERKGKDDKYYKIAYMALSGEDQQKVCDAIYQKLDG